MSIVIKELPEGLAITVDSQLFARYVVDQANKLYRWPIYGPTCDSMTRAYPTYFCKRIIPVQC